MSTTLKQLEAQIVDLKSELAILHQKFDQLTSARQPKAPKKTVWCDSIEQFVHAYEVLKADITPLPERLCKQAVDMARVWRANAIAKGEEYRWVRIVTQERQKQARPA